MDAAGAPDEALPFAALPGPGRGSDPADGGAGEGSPSAATSEVERPALGGDQDGGWPAGAASGLTDREERILAFERQWWKHAGAKEQAVRERFGISATRYYQLLNKIIDKHEALVFDPMLVKRLRRLRTTRARARSARRLGIDLR